MPPKRDTWSVGVLAHMHHPIVEPFQGGLEAHTAQVCRELVRRGHDVTIYAKEGTRIEGVEVVTAMPASFTWPANATAGDMALDAAFARACEMAQSHDVVLNNSLNPTPYVALPDAAMLTVLHTPATLERVNAVVGAPTWRPGPRHGWVSVSQFNAHDWQALMRSTQVGVVHNGIDLTLWPVGETPGEHLAWTGRITPEKGLHVAIDAAREAGLAMKIAGPESNAEYMAAEITPRLAAGDDIEYLGHLSHGDLPRLLGGAAAFACTPLWDEPFGLAPLEAMACGTPVAALRRGALPEVLGETGGVLADGPEDLAEAMIAATRLDRGAVRERAEGFALSAMVDRYEEILGDLLATAPR